MNRTAILTALSPLILLCTGVLQAQPANDSDIVTMAQRKLSGPRMGITYVAQSKGLARSGEMIKSLKDHNIGPVISQFGWHFEWLVAPEQGGPAFVTEVIPLIGGVEYSTIIPSTSLIFGIRLPEGFEFGMGPSILVNPTGEKPVNTSLVTAIGQSLNFRGVSIPLNLALITNGDGTRLSFIFGYALKYR